MLGGRSWENSHLALCKIITVCSLTIKEFRTLYPACLDTLYEAPNVFLLDGLDIG